MGMTSKDWMGFAVQLLKLILAALAGGGAVEFYNGQF